MLQSAKQLLQKSLILTTPKINLAGSKIINRQASAAYEGDGKTTVSIMNNEVENGLMVNSYSQVSKILIISRPDKRKNIFFSTDSD